MRCTSEVEGRNDLESAFRNALIRSGAESVLGIGIETRGLDCVRAVAMGQAKLETVITLLLRRAIAASQYGDRIVVQAERHSGQNVRLSVIDSGPPVPAMTIARALRKGLGREDPGLDPLAWVYLLVAQAGGCVTVRNGDESGTEVSCTLLEALES